MEGVLLRVLERSLGKYVDGIGKENLKLGVFSGELQMRNMTLKKEALDSFQLPLQVVRGSVASIDLKIPWRKLTSEPVIVQIKDVFIVAVPTDTSNWTARDFGEFAWKRKKVQISNEDKILSNQLVAALDKDSSSNDKHLSWTEVLTTKILSNLHVTIENVHIRYEHMLTAVLDASAPHNIFPAFALGLTLKSLTARSTNSSWQVSFESDPGLTRKQVDLSSLSLYCHTHTVAFPKLEDAKFQSQMADAVKKLPEGATYMLAPVDARFVLGTFNFVG
jgi:vacuolar protein sorting-associated protein 13A/C